MMILQLLITSCCVCAADALSSPTDENTRQSDSIMKHFRLLLLSLAASALITPVVAQDSLTPASLRAYAKALLDQGHIQTYIIRVE